MWESGLLLFLWKIYGVFFSGPRRRRRSGEVEGGHREGQGDIEGKWKFKQEKRCFVVNWVFSFEKFQEAQRQLDTQGRDALRRAQVN